MPDAVETMAWVREKPWHGLGNEVSEDSTIPEWLKESGLDWRIDKRPIAIPSSIELGENLELQYDTFDLEVSNTYALTRSTDNRVFDIVGKSYRPTQNEAILEFFRDFVEAGDATIETLGALQGGQYVWALAKLGESFKVDKKDSVEGYVLLCSPHKKGRCLIVRQTSVRVVCWNTLSLALRQAGQEWRMTHRREFDDKAIKEAKHTLDLTRESFQQFASTAQSLKKITLAADEAVRILAEIINPKLTEEQLRDVVRDTQELASRPLRKVLAAYEKAPGADPGTAWGVFNAVTYWSDHIASRTQDTRLTSAWFGPTANTKERALELLLK